MSLELDVRRSLAVTEQAVLSNFSLERVMNQLAERAEIPGLTGLALFQQWWDTQIPRLALGPGLIATTKRMTGKIQP